MSKQAWLLLWTGAILGGVFVHVLSLLRGGVSVEADASEDASAELARLMVGSCMSQCDSSKAVIDKVVAQRLVPPKALLEEDGVRHVFITDGDCFGAYWEMNVSVTMEMCIQRVVGDIEKLPTRHRVHRTSPAQHDLEFVRLECSPLRTVIVYSLVERIAVKLGRISVGELRGASGLIVLEPAERGGLQLRQWDILDATPQRVASGLYRSGYLAPAVQLRKDLNPEPERSQAQHGK